MKEEDMKTIKLALSIVVLLGTVGFISASGGQAGKVTTMEAAPPCDCDLHNPEGVGVLKNGSCDEVRCYTLPE